MSICLCERLTFDNLFRISDPKRVYRSFTVHGPPLEIDSYQDTVYYTFNFKSDPSTTGLRHRGYIKFFKPKRKNPNDVPLQHLDCVVDCMCPDFRYRWAWANKQRGSSVVGPNSLNKAHNRAPRITNPSGKPGICKHLLAARQHIYGLLSSFDGDEPDTAEKLNKLTKIATKRWTDFGGAMRAAREREAKYNAGRQARNLGIIKPQNVVEPSVAKKQAAEPTPVAPTSQPVSVIAPQTTVGRAVPVRPVAAKTPPKPGAAPKSPAVKLPAAKPVEQPSPEEMPPKGPQAAVTPKKSTKQAKPTARRVIGNRVVSGMLPGSKPGMWESEKLSDMMRVVMATGHSTGDSTMKLNEAIKMVEELEAEELALAQPDTDMDSSAEDFSDDIGMPEPMEPPVSDSAVGADTEGETALSLLRQMRDLIADLVTAVAPEAGAGAAGAAGEMPEEPMDMLPTGEEEMEAGEAEEEAEEEEEEDEIPKNTRPSASEDEEEAAEEED